MFGVLPWGSLSGLRRSEDPVSVLPILGLSSRFHVTCFKELSRLRRRAGRVAHILVDILYNEPNVFVPYADVTCNATLLPSAPQTSPLQTELTHDSFDFSFHLQAFI